MSKKRKILRIRGVKYIELSEYDCKIWLSINTYKLIECTFKKLTGYKKLSM